MNNTLLSTHDAAARLGISRRTLMRFRLSGDGPAFVRVGKNRVGYAEEAIAAFVASRTAGSVAEERARRPAKAA